MSKALLLSIHLEAGRYHGEGDWPPAPARVFQALVAGAARGAHLDAEALAAFSWLERLDPPVIAVPSTLSGQAVTAYVPNNDLDAVGGDPALIAKIRTEKQIRPRIFDGEIPFLYCWTVSETDWETSYAQTIVTLAEGLYQLGRGIDMAWAKAEILDEDTAEERVQAYPGAVHRPSVSGNGLKLPCPQAGSLESLRARFAAGRRRFETQRSGRSVTTSFMRPPRPQFRSVAYDCPADRILLELRDPDDLDNFAPWPLAQASVLSETVRDHVIARLNELIERDREALPFGPETLERFIRGVGAQSGDKSLRVRFIPLPSIGHEQTDPGIRRLLIERPQGSPVSQSTLEWAVRDLTIVHEPQPIVHLSRSDQHQMLRHYGIEGPGGRASRVWRTVTPAALPERAARRRIDPDRQREDAKSGSERASEELKAVNAVRHALRHADLVKPVTDIRVQREPFGRKGARAEDFAHGTRFSKHALWHVEIAFAEPVTGPVMIGDGRYMGLGLMAPAMRLAAPGAYLFQLDPQNRLPRAEQAVFLHHVRRALMALDRESGRDGKVSLLFSGHKESGEPARSGDHRHIFLAAYGAPDSQYLDRLYVFAPWLCDRHYKPEQVDKHRFKKAMTALETVRAGPLGVFHLSVPTQPADGDPLTGPGQVWESWTPYVPTRYPKANTSLDDEACQDILVECVRRGWPRPRVELIRTELGARGGLRVWARLIFETNVSGPLVLGRDSHRGGGVFIAG